MSQIRLMTDSTADIPAELRQELGIAMVPLKIHFGEETYLDAVTLQPEQFYEKLAAAPSLPKTSQPSPLDFVECFKQVAAESPGASIISVHLGSVLSGTYQSALLAASMLEGEIDVTVVDSRSASYGCGLQVVKAAEAARAGATKEQCLELMATIKQRNSLYFLVDTLDYLQKGGRIGKASAFIGSLLNIKPILTLDEDGTVTSVDKVRGHRKAMQRIIELLQDEGAFGGENDVIIAHSNDREKAEELSGLIGEHFRVRSLTYTSLGPVIGTHVGPGTVAVFMLPADVLS
ncbi:DegV family protein [Paenibacillus cymbidii]|uniref:DegV family protein n=1 Tax=Paenibacillus cymbidii TaxID=1639034 RepID=UPI00108118CE|nr:DegV family protein [Paenibacillus cymbidii]